MTHLPSGRILDYDLEFPDPPTPEQSWTTMYRPTPQVRDAFAGAPEHASYQALRHELRINAQRVEALVATTKSLEAQLSAATQLARVTRMEAERRRAVSDAQTVFVLEHWNKHPEWTSGDAHLAMQMEVKRSSLASERLWSVFTEALEA